MKICANCYDQKQCCKFEDCNNLVVNNGECVRHGVTVRLRLVCSVEGCTNEVLKGGVCIKHVA